MEVRSSRRMRTLVTRMALRGLSANELARALISMMARSTTRSNQRPDTLMQDRSPPVRRNPLATHGRTIHCDAGPDHTFGSIAAYLFRASADQCPLCAKIDALCSDANNWRNAANIRIYVAAVREALGEIADHQMLESWSQWALAEADKLDPIASGRIADSISGRNECFWFSLGAI